MKKVIFAALIAALALVMVGCSCSAQSSSAASSSASTSSSTASSSASAGSSSASASSASASASASSASASSAASQSSAASSSAAPSPSSSSSADDGQNPVMNFIGVYGADRATITVNALGQNEAEFSVEWASSAAEGSTWTMSGTFDPNTLTVNYTNCVKTDYVYDDAENRTETTVYTDGKGSFTFDGGSNLTWNDEQEHIADGTTFTWAA